MELTEYGATSACLKVDVCLGVVRSRAAVGVLVQQLKPKLHDTAVGKRAHQVSRYCRGSSDHRVRDDDVIVGEEHADGIDAIVD